MSAPLCPSRAAPCPSTPLERSQPCAVAPYQHTPSPHHRLPGERTLDPDQYRQAEELDAAYPRWWVLWAPHSRVYFAFFLGPHRVEPVCAATVEELCAALARVEHEAAPPPAAVWRSGPQAPVTEG